MTTQPTTPKHMLSPNSTLDWTTTPTPGYKASTKYPGYYWRKKDTAQPTPQPEPVKATIQEPSTPILPSTLTPIETYEVHNSGGETVELVRRYVYVVTEQAEEPTPTIPEIVMDYQALDEYHHTPMNLSEFVTPMHKPRPYVSPRLTPAPDKTHPIPTPDKLVEKLLKVNEKSGRAPLTYQVVDNGIAYAADGNRVYVDTQPPQGLHNMHQLPEGLRYPDVQYAIKMQGQPLCTLTLTPYHLRRACYAALVFAKESSNMIFIHAGEDFNLTGTSEETGSTTTTLTHGDKWETAKGNKPVVYTKHGATYPLYLNVKWLIEAVDYVAGKDETPITIELMKDATRLIGATRSALIVNMKPSKDNPYN